MTISGYGFVEETSKISVTIGDGVDCPVDYADYYQIKCTTQKVDSPSMLGPQIGNPGLRMGIYSASVGDYPELEEIEEGTAIWEDE